MTSRRLVEGGQRALTGRREISLRPFANLDQTVKLERRNRPRAIKAFSVIRARAKLGVFPWRVPGDDDGIAREVNSNIAVRHRTLEHRREEHRFQCDSE